MDLKNIFQLFNEVSPDYVAIMGDIGENFDNNIFKYFDENNIDSEIFDINNFYSFNRDSIKSDEFPFDSVSDFDVVIINGFKNWSFIQNYIKKLGENLPLTILLDFEDYYNKELYKLNTLNIIGEIINGVQEKILFYSFDISNDISVLSMNNSVNYDIMMNFQKNHILYGFINLNSSYSNDNFIEKEISDTADYDYLKNDRFLEDNELKKENVINDLYIKNYNFYYENVSLKENNDILIETNKMFLNDISDLRLKLSKLEKDNLDYVNQISSKNNQLNNLQNKLDKQDLDLDEIKQKNIILKDEKNAILSSKSWKLTSPFRKLSNLFSKNE